MFVSQLSPDNKRVLNNVHMKLSQAELTSPSGIANAMIVEQFVDAFSILAWILGAATEVDFFLTSFASESWRASAGKIRNQVCTVSA